VKVGGTRLIEHKGRDKEDDKHCEGDRGKNRTKKVL